jgi:hypothetical protein
MFLCCIPGLRVHICAPGVHTRFYCEANTWLQGLPALLEQPELPECLVKDRAGGLHETQPMGQPTHHWATEGPVQGSWLRLVGCGTPQPQQPQVTRPTRLSWSSGVYTPATRVHAPAAPPPVQDSLDIRCCMCRIVPDPPGCFRGLVFVHLEVHLSDPRRPSKAGPRVLRSGVRRELGSVMDDAWLVARNEEAVLEAWGG